MLTVLVPLTRAVDNSPNGQRQPRPQVPDLSLQQHNV